MNGIAGRLAAPLLATVLAAASFAVMGQSTPESLLNARVVMAEEVQRLMQNGVPVIDTRVANEYAEEHVKGAKSVPYKEKSTKAADFDGKLDSFDLAKLPANKAAPIVFYCNAGECWKSYKASVTALRAGYSQVLWFRGGMPEWKVRKLPTE